MTTKKPGAFRGRPRKPTSQLKVYRDKLYPSRVGDRSREPQPKGKPKKPPKLVGKWGNYCWAKTVPSLIATRVVTEQDEPALIAMCLAFERWMEFKEAKDYRVWRELSAQFGLTPAERTRVQTVSRTCI